MITAPLLPCIIMRREIERQADAPSTRNWQKSGRVRYCGPFRREARGRKGHTLRVALESSRSSASPAQIRPELRGVPPGSRAGALSVRQSGCRPVVFVGRLSAETKLEISNPKSEAPKAAESARDVVVE